MIVAGLLLASKPAPAGDSGPWSPPAGAAADYAAAMRAADALAERAALLHRADKDGARRLAERAIQAYERAAEAAPGRAEPHYSAAELLYSHFASDERTFDSRRGQRAVQHWEAFERLAPLDPRLGQVLFHRSIVYTKLGGQRNYERAQADYRRQLGLLDVTRDGPGLIAMVLSNAAEILMAMGELDQAIEFYQRAIELEDRPLYGYGLAVALDRDGQGAKAREVMLARAQSDQLRALSEQGVFFVPDGDVHYYYALGHEALGDARTAIAHYERFLDIPATSRFHERARDNLAVLRRALTGRRAPAGDRPRPATRGASRQP